MHGCFDWELQESEVLYNYAYQHFKGLRRLYYWLCNSSTNRRKKSRVRLLIVSFKLYHYSIARTEKIRTEYLMTQFSPLTIYKPLVSTSANLRPYTSKILLIRDRRSLTERFLRIKIDMKDV